MQWVRSDSALGTILAPLIFRLPGNGDTPYPIWTSTTQYSIRQLRRYACSRPIKRKWFGVHLPSTSKYDAAFPTLGSPYFYVTSFNTPYFVLPAARAQFTRQAILFYFVIPSRPTQHIDDVSSSCRSTVCGDNIFVCIAHLQFPAPPSSFQYWLLWNLRSWYALAKPPSLLR